MLVVLLFAADAGENYAGFDTNPLCRAGTGDPRNRAQVAPEHPMRIEPAALAARAEAPPTKKRVTRTQPPVEAVSAMVAEIAKSRRHSNLSSAIRQFVLDQVRNGTPPSIRDRSGS